MSDERIETLALNADLGSLQIARELVRTTVSELDGDPSPAELVVTELVTNAVLHGLAPIELTVRREHDGDAVSIAVSDCSPDPPRRRTPSSGERGGRGLLLIDAMSTNWGVTPNHQGKSVWAVVDIVPRSS